MKCEVWKGETAFYCVSELNQGLEAVWEVPNSQVLVHIFIHPACDLRRTVTESTAMLGDTRA